MEKTLINKVLLIVGGLMCIYIIKPNIIFKPNGKLREYGLGYDSEGYRKTLYSMQTIILVLVLGVYIWGNSPST